jgi:hypothetical protein
LIADDPQDSYLEVLIMASIPTILYYASILFMVEGDARRLSLKQVSLGKIDVVTLTRQYWFHFASLVTIVIFMALGFTAMTAVFYSILISIGTRFLNKESALYPKKLIAALSAGTKQVLGVASTCACAGIIVGVINLTGIGLKFSGIIVDLAGGNLADTNLSGANLSGAKLRGADLSDIISDGIIPATLEIMDNLVIRAVEESVHAVYPTDAEAVFAAVEALGQAPEAEWACPNTALRLHVAGETVAAGERPSAQDSTPAAAGGSTTSGAFPNDWLFPQQWHLHNTGQSGGTPGADIRAPEAGRSRRATRISWSPCWTSVRRPPGGASSTSTRPKFRRPMAWKFCGCRRGRSRCRSSS